MEQRTALSVRNPVILIMFGVALVALALGLDERPQRDRGDAVGRRGSTANALMRA